MAVAVMCIGEVTVRMRQRPVHMGMAVPGARWDGNIVVMLMMDVVHMLVVVHQVVSIFFRTLLLGVAPASGHAAE